MRPYIVEEISTADRSDIRHQYVIYATSRSDALGKAYSIHGPTRVGYHYAAAEVEFCHA